MFPEDFYAMLELDHKSNVVKVRLAELNMIINGELLRLRIITKSAFLAEVSKLQCHSQYQLTSCKLKSFDQCHEGAYQYIENWMGEINIKILVPENSVFI